MQLLGFLGGYEWIIVAVVGLLVFGRRLPSVARSLGSSYNQFRAGLKDEVKAIHHETIDTKTDEHNSNETEPTTDTSK